ncbi:MAG: hypothetical protein H5U05_08995, partial [Candidatus Aminicenantes bacterium]|nr:hypothetical protein [Candidatus Aminicenantes bacterium]
YTQHDIKAAVEGTVKVVKLRADLGATLEELRQKGAIQLEIVGENENMQKLLETAYNHILELMCERVPVGPAQATSSIGRRPVTMWNNVGLYEIFGLAVGPEDFSAAEERFHGGPFAGQQQQGQASSSRPCSDEAKIEADDLHHRAASLNMSKKWREAIEAASKAQELCPHYNHLMLLGNIYYNKGEYMAALPFYQLVCSLTNSSSYIEGAPLGQRSQVERIISKIKSYISAWSSGLGHLNARRFDDAVQSFLRAYEEIPDIRCLFFIGKSYYMHFDNGVDIDEENFNEKIKALEDAAISYFRRFIEEEENYFPQEYQNHEFLDQAKLLVLDLSLQPTVQAQTRDQAAARTERDSAEARRVRRRENQGVAQQAQQTGQTQQAGQTTTEGAAATGAQQTITGAERAATETQGQQATTTGQTTTQTGQTTAQTGQTGQAAQQTTSGQTTSGTQTTPPPTTTSGAQAATQTGRPQAAQPTTPAPEVRPIVNVQLGYSFKRTKLSGKYEVDMRRRLREDREIVMSGNISGVFQKYGEDKRFFTVVSLDDPTFQERSIEVILDGQDAEDFKNYVNSVSVIFRKQRVAGPVMTGEVKFFEQQFAERGNRLSFKYGRVNEAATEWLNYEYKTKWNFYGGVEWESDWVKTQDSVLTLTPPVKRRTIEISLDEDNILQNKIKAVAIQVKHNIYGKDILKEVVINYDKGDPLTVNYTYLHEEGKPGYSYRTIWLTLDGKEVETNWVNREGPFIYAVYSK